MADLERTKSHYANGKLCGCRMRWSDDPAAYAEEHPNKKIDEAGTTFNDALDDARHLATATTPAR